MLCQRILLFSLLLLALGAHAAAVFDGKLLVAVTPRRLDVGGTATIHLSFSTKTDAACAQRTMAQRTASFAVYPYRFSLFSPAPVPVSAERMGDENFTLTLPATLSPGWYLLIATVSAQPGENWRQDAGDDADTPIASGVNLDEKNPLSASQVIGLRTAHGEAMVRLSTERARCVFCPGEQIRLFASGRGTGGVHGPVTLLLAPRGGAGRPLLLARGDLAADPGQERTLAFDLPADLTRGIAPGAYELLADFNGRTVDRYPVNFVAPALTGAKARWWHGLPFGIGGGLNPDPITPGWLERHAHWVDDEAIAVHNANFWVNLFAGETPITGPAQTLPGADDADMPPAAAEYCPSSTHALYQLLMARGISLGVMMGYTEAGPENYMPLPTVFQDQMDIIARKYLMGALSLAQFPHFTGVYTDMYAKPDWHGGGELSKEQSDAVHTTLYARALAAAGVTPAPAPRDGYGFPFPNGLETAGPTAEYKYTEYVQRGLERCYGTITRTLERELPAAFTIQNRNRENHTTVPYSWQWSRSPSVPAEYSHGCTVVACSEFNLDGEPQPYLTTTETNRTLLDEGRPVWRTAAFQFNGAQSRFLRDAVFLSGRGVTPFYTTPESSSWSQKGADQSAYAARDRLRTVSRFLTTYEGLFDTLQPVREVAFYLHPGWADPNAASLLTGLPCALMTGHQVEVVSHADLPQGALNQYKVLFAPGLTEPFRYPFENTAVKAFVAQGGAILGTPAETRYYAGHIDPTQFGIQVQVNPVLNKDGSPVVNKETKQPEVRTSYTETLDQRARLTQAYVWKDFPTAAVLPVDFTDQWAYTDATGKHVGYSGRAHWTGYQLWANAHAPAVEHAAALKAALDKVNDPLIVKDQPEVFVCAERPRDPAAGGLFLFVSNFTIPDDPAWTVPRVPYFFWPTYARPCIATIKVKAQGIGAIYDLLTGKSVSFLREGNRLSFQANLCAVEGRVYACYPQPITGASLRMPATAVPGALLRGQFHLLANGQPAPYQGAITLQVNDGDGRELYAVQRALGADGLLPAWPIPGNVQGPLRVSVTDTITGKAATATVALADTAPAPAGAADAVTVYRGDAIYRLLTDKTAPPRIVVTEGREDFGVRKKEVPVEEQPEVPTDDHAIIGDDRKMTKTALIDAPYREIVPSNVNPDVERERRWAQALAAGLQHAGIAVTIVNSTTAVTGPLLAHPWAGKEAGVREGHTVPDRHIDGPVIIVGSAKTNVFLNELECACVAPRSFGRDNAANGRAVLAFLPRAFSPEADALAVVADDDAGLQAAVARLIRLARANPGVDPFYAAREHVRYAWLPADVARFKAQQGIADPGGAPVPTDGNLAIAPARQVALPGFEEPLGPHIFALDASPNGIAVGLTTLARPLGLLAPDGTPRLFTGGAASVWPHDVAVSADGRTVMAGFALGGVTTAYAVDGAARWSFRANVVHKDDPLGWETYKDSESFLGISPDHTIVVVAGVDGTYGRDANSGKQLWRLPSPAPGIDPAAQMPFSPDGKYVLVYTSAPAEGEDIHNEVSLVEAATGTVVWHGPRDVSDWELYALVGPAGAWTITSGRGATFALRDEQGAVLRVFTPAQMPEAIAAARGLIPPLYLAGLSPNRLVLAKPETRGIYLMDLRLGTPAQRAAARNARQENEENARKLDTELRNTKNYPLWTPEYVEAFMAGITAPTAAKKLMAERMQRVPAEKRAGRTRKYTWLVGDFETFKQLQFEEDRAIFEAAVTLEQRRAISLPAILCDAKVDPQVRTVYAALWDDTVRAYDLDSGQERWRTPVIGGCQLALTGAVLYAGGSHGDLYRLDAATGAVQWKRNVAGDAAL